MARWITFYHDTQYSQRGWFTNLLLSDIPQDKAPRTGSHHIWHTYTLPFLSPREQHRRQHSWIDDFTGQCLLRRLLSRKAFFPPTIGLPTNLRVRQSWLFTASPIKFLTRRSLKSRWVYLAPHEDNSIQLLSIANNYNGLPYLFSSVWPAQFQKPDSSEYEHLQWQQNRSKAMMRLLYKIPAIQGWQKHF